MSHYTGAVPDTRRKADWRDRGVCRTEDPEIFFASNDEAKAYCARCPVTDACLQFALTNSIQDGVFGGLDEDERKNLRRRTGRGTQQPRGPKQPHPTSLRELFNRHTSPADGGHLLWTGCKTPDFRKRQYTPNQIAFIVDRGYEPNGAIRRLCGVRGCVQPLHLADTAERHQRAAVKAAA